MDRQGGAGAWYPEEGVAACEQSGAGLQAREGCAAWGFDLLKLCGAGDENRTHAVSLEESSGSFLVVPAGSRIMPLTCYFISSGFRCILAAGG